MFNASTPCNRRIAIKLGTLTVCSVALVGCSAGTGSEAAGKKFPFRGTVVSVEANHKLANIKGDKVDGWMEAMTMDYPVPDPADLNKLKPGQEIHATLVVNGDEYSLHHIVPVNQPAK